MNIFLDAIKFNHDPTTVHNNAINIRKNASEFIEVPEWRAGISVNPEDSRAAYAKKETAGNTMTIEARFRWLGKGAKTVKYGRWIRPLIRLGRPDASALSFGLSVG